MNRSVVAVILLVISVALAITCHFYVKNTCDSMLTLVDNVLEETITENTEKVNFSTVLLNSQWKSKKFLFNFFLGQNDFSTVEAYIGNALLFSEIQDNEALVICLSELREELRRIKRSNDLDLQTAL